MERSPPQPASYPTLLDELVVERYPAAAGVLLTWRVGTFAGACVHRQTQMEETRHFSPEQVPPMQRSMLLSSCSMFLVALMTLRCGPNTSGSKDAGVQEPEGTPTGSVCPPTNTLTYENFGQPFMTQYCVRCHSSTLQGDARNGAPEFHDFDTKAGILVVAEHVDERAAAGPNAVNTIMPPGSPFPTEVERRQLGQWLACEMAENTDGGAQHAGDGGH